MYSLVLNRTTLGYEVRAVGHNPEAARYGGINVPRNYFLAMAIAGMFAGLAGALDLLGWQYRVDITTIQGANIGFIGIAVALLGRNTAVGVGLSALLFAALQTGTASRNLDPTIFAPGVGGSLAVIIQGLVVLFVGADVLILICSAGCGAGAQEGAGLMAVPRGSRALAWLRRDRDRRLRGARRAAAGRGAQPGFPIAIGLLAVAIGLAFWLIRGERRIGGYAIAAG